MLSLTFIIDRTTQPTLPLWFSNYPFKPRLQLTQFERRVPLLQFLPSRPYSSRQHLQICYETSTRFCSYTRLGGVCACLTFISFRSFVLPFSVPFGILCGRIHNNPRPSTGLGDTFQYTSPRAVASSGRKRRSLVPTEPHGKAITLKCRFRPHTGFSGSYARGGTEVGL